MQQWEEGNVLSLVEENRALWKRCVEGGVEGSDLGDSASSSPSQHAKRSWRDAIRGDALRMGSSGVTAGDAESIAKWLGTQEGRALTELHLPGNWVRDSGAVALAEALKANTTLRVVNLGRNRIGDEGARAFADCLRVNRTLRELNLWGNQIGESGFAALQEALRGNQSLKRLFVQDNLVDAPGRNEREEEKTQVVVVAPIMDDHHNSRWMGAVAALSVLVVVVGVAAKYWL